MTEGRHVLGHAVLESWEALARAGSETAPMDTPEIIQRATRDIKLLAACLDASVAMMSDMVNAYGVNVDRGGEMPVGVGTRGASADEQPASTGKGITVIWPADEFKNLGALATWVKEHSHLAIPMSRIIREAGHSSAAELTIAEAKVAVERILARKAGA